MDKYEELFESAIQTIKDIEECDHKITFEQREYIIDKLNELKEIIDNDEE